MDTRALGLLSLFFLTAWSSPRAVEQSDFRASLRLKPVITNRYSPALAALEDSRLDIKTTAKSSNDLAQTLKTGKKYAWNSKPPVKMNLPKIVISQDTKIDHLRELVGEVQDKPTSTVTVNDYAEILVKEELARRAHESTSTRVITSSTGNKITVAPAASVRPSAPARVMAANFTKPTPAPIVTAPKVLANNVAKQPDAVPANTPIILAANMRDLPPQNPFEPEAFEVTGGLTFEKGAAMIVGRQNLTVQQVVDGQVVAAGLVNLPDASYRVVLHRLEGDLVANLRGQSGQLLAAAKVNLAVVAEKNLNQHRIKNISLSIVPATSNTEAVVVAAAALGGKKTPIANASLLIEGMDRGLAYNTKEKAFVDSTLIAPSTFMVRAEAPNYWSTIGLAQSGERFQLQLLPLKLIEALLSLTLDKYKAREAIDRGLIWGHVLMGGHPVEGAQISIVGETEKNPVYFTGFIPDKMRSTTATGGEFAFTRLEAGEKMVRVNLAEKIFWPVLLPIREKSVTYADLEIQPRRAIDFKSYDAFTGKAQVAQVQPLGTDDIMNISSTGQVRVENETLSGVSYFESIADGEHELIRASLRPGQTEVRFPFVTRAWVALAKARLKLKDDANAGAAIFFVNGDDYDVIVGAAADYRAQNIVYFDATGKFTNKPSDGGGFLVLNLPTGFHAITLIPEKSKKIVTQLVYADHFALAAENVSLMY